MEHEPLVYGMAGWLPPTAYDGYRYNPKDPTAEIERALVCMQSSIAKLGTSTDYSTDYERGLVSLRQYYDAMLFLTTLASPEHIPKLCSYLEMLQNLANDQNLGYYSFFPARVLLATTIGFLYDKETPEYAEAIARVARTPGYSGIGSNSVEFVEAEHIMLMFSNGTPLDLSKVFELEAERYNQIVVANSGDKINPDNIIPKFLGRAFPAKENPIGFADPDLLKAVAAEVAARLGFIEPRQPLAGIVSDYRAKFRAARHSAEGLHFSPSVKPISIR